MYQQISIANLIQQPSPLLKLGVWCLDKVMGVAKMNQLYQQHGMQGLSKEAFADKLLEILQIELDGIAELQQRIPKNGPVVIASNHPFGGIEGVVLARAISEVRPDLKVLANKGLGIFAELQDYFIFTNPLSANDPKNAPSLRQCISHIRDDGALLLFPAGRVSHFDKAQNAVVEHRWNKIVGKLSGLPNTRYLPIHVEGQNSDWFYRIERVYFKMRMFLLGRELLNKKQAKIAIHSGFPVATPSGLTHQENADLCRALSYAQHPQWRYQWPADKSVEQAPLLAPVSPTLIESEIDSIPDEQCLVKTKTHSVFFGYQSQIPNIVTEIARLRELVFRQHDEGSGEPIDTDRFDATYTQLFIYEHKHKRIVGAYRMGRTDVLLENEGLDGLYLNRMFDFKPSFINRSESCLEMGRSWLIPEYQGSYQGLLLLWKGIGAFVCKFPKYRTLYGTVSISKLYDPRSVKLIEDVLVDPQSHQHVKPKHHFEFEQQSQLQEFIDNHKNPKLLSAFLKSLEVDGKDIPILAKQYLKMGAKFHALGIDVNFNHTPGLLLSVDMAKAPDKLLKIYLGKDFKQFQDFHL